MASNGSRLHHRMEDKIWIGLFSSLMISGTNSITPAQLNCSWANPEGTRISFGGTAKRERQKQQNFYETMLVALLDRLFYMQLTSS